MSMSSEEKDPFRYRHMIPTDALQVRPLANAGQLIPSFTVSNRSREPKRKIKMESPEISASIQWNKVGNVGFRLVC